MDDSIGIDEEEEEKPKVKKRKWSLMNMDTNKKLATNQVEGQEPLKVVSDIEAKKNMESNEDDEIDLFSFRRFRKETSNISPVNKINS